VPWVTAFCGEKRADLLAQCATHCVHDIALHAEDREAAFLALEGCDPLVAQGER